MQAIKCVVVGDGYVKRRIVARNVVSPKFELGRSGENLAKESAAARARGDDRRANRVVTSWTPNAPGLAMASISFPSANVVSGTRGAHHARAGP